MLNIKIFINIFLLLCSSLVNSQSFLNNTYVTSSFELISKHSISIEKDNITLTIFSEDLFYSENKIKFESEIKGDTICILNVIENVKDAKGLKLDNNKLISHFSNTCFYRESQNILIHTESNRPYFNKIFADDILDNQMVYLVNGEVLMSEKDSSMIELRNGS